jgi:hypothetical protein
VIPPRLRAGLVIASVVIASAIAGAAIDRALLVRRLHGPEAPRRSFQEQEDRRRTEMLDRMTKDLTLTAAQRAGLDSIFRRTDSLLRAIRRETQPRVQQVFQQSREEINARLDSTQRAKFATIRKNRVPDEYRGGGGGGRRGPRPDSGRQ